MIPKLLPLLGLAATLGCLGSSTSAPVVYHTLQPLQLEGAAPARSGLAVEVMPVRLPGLLQRPQMVVAQGSALGLTEAQRWGNPLDQDMQRVLVQDLELLLGSDAVVPSPYGERVGAVYQVGVGVLSCDAQSGPLTLEAVWILSRPGVAQAILVRRTMLREALSGAGADALAAAHSRIMAALAREIATELLKRP
jgi:uncharacterized lipoprotein YmbA